MWQQFIHVIVAAFGSAAAIALGAGAIRAEQQAPPIDTAVAAVSNLEVQVAGMPLFRPTGVSRIGMDIPVTPSPGGSGMIAAPPTFPAFKVMLPPNAPLTDLRNWWLDVENGLFARKDVVVRLQAPEGGNVFQDALIIEMEDSLLSGFSEGIVTPASITITPGAMRVTDAGLSSSVYSLIDLDPMRSPRVNVGSEATQAALYRLSGGERIVTYQIDPSLINRLGNVRAFPSFTDLAFTAVARAAGTTNDLHLFDQFFNWITAIVDAHEVLQRTVTITTVAAPGSPPVTVQYPSTLPTRISFINPLLVDPVTHIAPYVLDFTVRPQPPTP